MKAEHSIVRIFPVGKIDEDPKLRVPEGGGVLVDERHVLTCAHVLGEAGEEDTVWLDFSHVDGNPKFSATVKERDDDADLAVLEIQFPEDRKLPEAAVPARFMTADEDAFRSEVHICGFPKDRHFGDWIRGEFAGPTGEGWLQMDHALTSKLVKPGFSGAPAWVDDKRRAAGLVVQRFWKDGESSAYVVPVKKLLKVFPGLQMTTDDSPSNPPSVSRSVNVRGDATNTVVVTGNGNTILWNENRSTPTQLQSPTGNHGKPDAQAMEKTAIQPITILHLSDIQYGRHHVDNDARPPLYPSDDYSPQLETLIEDLEILEDRQEVKPQLVVITGDVAEWSLKAEYQKAETFLGGLAAHLGIDRRFVAMVPGNHDVNRKLCAAARLEAEAEDEPFLPPYFRKFRFFQRFFQEFYQNVSFPDTVPAYQFSEDLFVNFLFPELEIALLGLNSCVDESELEPHFGNITTEQLKKACREVNRYDPNRRWRRIALMHHNFVRSSANDAENLKDADDLKPILLREGIELILHGHQHRPRDEITGAGTAFTPVLATGSAGLDGPTLEGTARRYQVIQIAGDRGRVYRRSFDVASNCWKPDMRPDQDEVFDEFRLPGGTETPEPVPPGDETGPRALVVPEGYTRWVRRHCGKMDIDHLRQASRVLHVDLPEIFIPLFAVPPGDGKEAAEGSHMRGERKAENIETLIPRYPSLLVEGQAGSGKTTLFRHFCHAVLLGDPPADCQEVLPVLVYLRNLTRLEGDFLARPPTAETAEAILDAFFREFGMGLDGASVVDFCKAERCVLLLDGLDEIDRPFRNLLADSLADFQDRYGGRLLWSGRPHGLDGAVVDHFGSGHVRIESLNDGQVATFVRNWFCFMEREETAARRKTADDLLAEMDSHPYVKELRRTPLMLTAICMLYYDGGELPGQRAALYEKFIKCMLARRFGESDLEWRFLMGLALNMHRRKSLEVDECEALAEIGRLVSRGEDEAEEAYEIGLKKTFERIEQDCGILKLQDGRGRFAFWHKTFQEFLAAACLVSRERKDYAAAIAPFWDDDWYRETVNLYLTYLSLRNDGMANEIIWRVLKNEAEEPPYARWRLEAGALSDIDETARDPEVEKEARDSMLFILSSNAENKARADAGETLGRLGDPRDLKAFVPIPAGTYNLSKGEVEIETPFEIGKYPVTNGWFREFVEAGGYENTEWWTAEGRKWLAHTGTKAPRYWHDRTWNNPSAPVMGVCWWEAAAFLEWLTRSWDDGWRYGLPSEIQWEAAAAGKEGKGKYPWRGDWANDHCNSKESGLVITSVVGVFPKGETPEGVVDLSGNGWEWMEKEGQSWGNKSDFSFDQEVQALFEKDGFMDAFNEFVEKNEIVPSLRAGGCGDDRDFVSRAYFVKVVPMVRVYDSGFRAARTLL